MTTIGDSVTVTFSGIKEPGKIVGFIVKLDTPYSSPDIPYMYNPITYKYVQTFDIRNDSMLTGEIVTEGGKSKHRKTRKSNSKTKKSKKTRKH